MLACICQQTYTRQLYQGLQAGGSDRASPPCMVRERESVCVCVCVCVCACVRACVRACVLCVHRVATNTH